MRQFKIVPVPSAPAKGEGTKDETGPAFPVNGGGYIQPHPGMSYRQWLVGQCLLGMVGDPNRTGTHEAYGRDAVRFADGAIAALASPTVPA